jgi:hypothetical protein
VKLLDHIRIRWAWRSQRFALPGRRGRDEPAPYGYALPRDGLAPAAVAVIVAAALAAGGWLGMQTGSGGGAPAEDPAGLLDLQAPASADAASVGAAREAITALSTARADGRRDLAAAGSPSEQAAAAVALRRATQRAAAQFAGSEPALAGALRRDARAYAALASAAEAGDRAAYARASTAVASAERDVERLIGSVL